MADPQNPDHHAHDGPPPGPPPGPPAVPPPVSRRDFLFKLGLGLNGVAASLLAIPVIGYVLSAVFERKAQQAWIALGNLGDFPVDQTRLATYRNPFTRPWDGATADIPCWVRRMQDDGGAPRFQIFAINCAHLGCPVRWFPESRLFMCPCHGGVYYEDGSVASGPPPHGLYEYAFRVKRGQLEVRGGQTPNLAESV